MVSDQLITDAFRAVLEGVYSEGKVISLGFVRCHLLFAGFGASVDRYCVKQYSPLLFIKRIGSLCYAKGVESPSSWVCHVLLKLSR
jgi:hypothetical protein